jgi:hypothetical protein
MIDLVNELEKECRDLIYLSESDSPVKPFVFDSKEDLTHSLDELAASEFPGRRERKEFKELFSKLTVEKDWHGEFEKKSVKRFRVIEQLLTSYTNKNEVLRQGTRKIKIFAFGEGADGRIYGIEMDSVET